MKYAFLENPAWLDALQKYVTNLPFGQSEETYESLLAHLSGRSPTEINQAAIFLVNWLDSHENISAGAADSIDAKLNATNVAAHFDSLPQSSPLADASVIQYLAIGGLIKLYSVTVQLGDSAKLASVPKYSVIGAAEFLVDATRFDDWANFVMQIRPMAADNVALGMQNVKLQETITQLEVDIDKKVRAKAKRQLKKKKSASAKKGHAKHHAQKAQAIELYKAGKSPSVLQAAKDIAPKVHVEPKTVANWLYEYKKTATN